MLSKLINTIDELIATDPEPPALIHGDLWSGNLHRTASGQPALIDPAPYFAHREAELGMMQLFGGFAPRVLHAYDESVPPPAWLARSTSALRALPCDESSRALWWKLRAKR